MIKIRQLYLKKLAGMKFVHCEIQEKNTKTAVVTTKIIIFF